MSKNIKDEIRYEVITQEDPENGDLLVPLPLILLQQLGWKEGDTVDFSIDEQKRYIIKRISK
jgi:bifunctional DNA-binding transcriptional regulator/antitoxin component of YhaV-PrlF toxin-antitoxin module